MVDLEHYGLLLSKGWEWLDNCYSGDSDEILMDLMFQQGSYQYKVGMPKGGVKYTSEQLKLQGMVGIYKSGGRPVVVESTILPSNPFFADTPQPELLPMPLRHEIIDTPPQKVFSRAA